MIFYGLSVARNCLRPNTAPLTLLAIKRGLLCIFAKKLKGRHFMGQNYLILNLKKFNFIIYFDKRLVKINVNKKSKKKRKNIFNGP